MVTAGAPPRRSAPSWAFALEALAVAASPGLSYLVLRLRGMALPVLPDPSMHTTYIVDPRDIFTRYAAVFAPTARLREAARVGFLVPARIAYLLFGAVGGFFTFRYLLALLAVVPLYLLLRRVAGRWAGFAAIVVVMSSPVFVTAWGTDYPDSAVISYLTGGLCALAMPCSARRRPYWLAAAAGLFTLAVWSHSAAVPLGAAALLSYLVVRVLRQRDHLVRDAGVGLAAALVTTALLILGSWALIGQWNYLTPTWEAARYLATPGQEAIWHSSNWRWVLYDPYLLVPPAVLAAFVVVAGRRRLSTPQLFAGLAAFLAFAAAALLQFVGKVQMLEMHYFSSLLWSFVAVLTALTFASLAAPFATGGAPGESWALGAARKILPAALLVAIPLAYEADPHVPQMTFGSWGWAVAAIVVAAAVAGRAGLAFARRPAAGLALAAIPLAALVLVAGASLILTVAGQTELPPLEHMGAIADPIPTYSSALGGNDTVLVEQYQVTCELPGFVGHPAYPGEQLLTWWPPLQTGELTGPIGIFHSGFNAITTREFPELDAADQVRIELRRPAQVLLMSVTGEGFPRAVRSLGPFEPVVVRQGVLSDGSFHLHVWLVDLGRYLR